MGAWTPLLGERVHLRVGGRPPVIGREAALVELEWLLGSVRTFGRTHLDLWVATEGDGIFALFAELELEWASSEPRPALVPCVVIVRAREGLIEDIRFYLDLGSR